MHCRAGEAHDRFIMQQREAAQMCWEREILIAYIFKTASLVWMGGTIKQNRAINWGHLESCHFPFCARLFASIQKYSVIHCQCCAWFLPRCLAPGWSCPYVQGCLTAALCLGRHTQHETFLFIWIKWWKERVMARVLSWGFWNSCRKRRQTNHHYIYR